MENAPPPLCWPHWYHMNTFVSLGIIVAMISGSIALNALLTNRLGLPGADHK